MLTNLSILLLPPIDPIKSTLPGILLGAVIGIAVVGLFGWGIAALLGRKFVIRAGLLAITALVGLVGAVIGDAKSATKRPLEEREIECARKVFGESIDYSKVRLVLHTRLVVWPRRRINKTPFNSIYLSKKFSKTYKLGGEYEDLLIHEMTHVWQTQHRIPFYKKLGTALRVIINKKKPYNYGGYWALDRAEERKANFRDFNTEQQGKIMEHYFCCAFHEKYRPEKQDCEHLEFFARQVRYNNGYYIEKDTFP